MQPAQPGKPCDSRRRLKRERLREILPKPFATVHPCLY